MKYQAKVQNNLEHIGAADGWTYTSVSLDYRHADTLYPSSADDMRCELCGHKLKRSYRITNSDASLYLDVGSECVKLFTGEEPVDTEIREAAAEVVSVQKALERLHEEDKISRLDILIFNDRIARYTRCGKHSRAEAYREFIKTEHFNEYKKIVEKHNGAIL